MPRPDSTPTPAEAKAADGKVPPRNPWLWVPSLYVGQGTPYAMVNAASVIMYKGLGISNARITFYTGLLSWPWVLKPLWSPVVDILKTRRSWIVAMQFLICAGFGATALMIPSAHFFRHTLVILFLIALASATHDIAADGFYMLGLPEREQAFFVGIRNTCWRLALIGGPGLLVILAGKMADRTGNLVLAWSTGFALMTVLFLCVASWHQFILPRPGNDRPGKTAVISDFFAEFFRTFASFFRKPKIVSLLSFLLLYRFGEAQLVKIVPLFLQDPRAAGGLGLTTTEVGVVYNTVGVTALLAGGIAGGWLTSRLGLRACLWPMVLVMHVPDAVFIFLSHAQPHNLWLTGGCVAAEQFGYGFGFTAYMLYMIYIARGEHRTAHYAICTGFMALSITVPGMWSGKLQEMLGYPHFFLWVMLATIPGFIVTALIPLDAEFGRRAKEVAMD